MPAKLRKWYQLFIAFGTMTVVGVIALALRVISLGLLTHFNRKYLVAGTSKLILQLLGIKLILPDQKIFPKEPCFYTFNHNSSLDLFALTAMGFTNARFLLSEKTLKIIPLTIMALSIGVMYIPQKHHKKRRIRFFEKTEKMILKRKVSVFGSSEGVHQHKHGIAPFNRGVYHMATITRVPVVLLFIDIPEESNPLNSYRSFKNGLIRIECIGILDTVNWAIEDIDKNKEIAREIFVKKFNETFHTNIS
ncbi:MAG: 1-acyl-sn-glycerol-3-phosphate acyltransferase [Cyclobacteriaceae bacterium]|nr:1-acyl-sn-glycerol-3-phosphate acyltransferase [Cyclobacteriaceae bacterium]